MSELPTWEYYSDTEGIGGTIKEQIDDFVVEEKADPDTESGDSVIVKMKKFNMTTMEAIRELSNILHVSRKRFGYAGNKDKRAITTQYVSVEGLDEEDLQHVFIPDLEIEVVGKGEPVGLGNLEGNGFEIVVRNIPLPKDEIEDRIDTIVEELDGQIPNYFGSQRFGSQRSITHEVGREMLKGDYEQAVWTYIAKPSEQEHEKIKKVREDLWESREVERAAEKFPEQYRYEKILLYHLAKNPEDYSGAIKRLPEGLQQLFIHAYQSYVFNHALSSLLADGFEDFSAELPLAGYKTSLRDEEGGRKIEELMEEDGIDQQDFKLPDFPHLRSEGDYRKCFVPFRDFDLKNIEDDELNMNKRFAEVSFELDSGSYATVFLRELMKNE
ncbi:MAG: tRNA pseudouridine(13) synthase TruD [Candidatus Nanohaloarchaeota archaeon QJJ-7]|nr:tRNA pseudouridine(13) synthase TruD [Candidatus Nanohaloarchaeota archaeon QJJ-7]